MAVPGARRLAPRRQRGGVRRRWRPRGGAGPRPSRRRASHGHRRRVGGRTPIVAQAVLGPPYLVDVRTDIEFPLVRALKEG